MSTTARLERVTGRRLKESLIEVDSERTEQRRLGFTDLVFIQVHRVSVDRCHSITRRRHLVRIDNPVEFERASIDSQNVAEWGGQHWQTGKVGAVRFKWMW